ncbi:MAG: ATP-binding cassette domain-containing protein [Bacilli bacterium]
MIKLENVTKKYGSKTVLSDVSITFATGKVTCLLGLNGVGKSTTMKAIMGLIPISSGRITLNDEKITGRNIGQIAYIPDIAIHDIGLTIDENLAIAQTFYPTFDVKKAEKMIAFFKVPRQKKLKELSKGNLARFNIIIGLAQNAPYIIMDEPFSGIDIFAREDFIAAMKSDFLLPNQTVILTTHEIDEVQNIADNIILLEEGQVFAEFTQQQAASEGLTVVEKMRTLYRGGKA